MTATRSPSGSVLLVNGHFLQAFFLCGVAWLIWPTSPEWWGFGLLSICLGGAGFACFVAALRAMAKLYVREREIARFSATAREPVLSDLADREALKSAGMIDD